MAVILTDKTGNESAMAIAFFKGKNAREQNVGMWDKEGLQ